MPRKKAASEKKYALLKLIPTEVGTGVQARKDIEVNQKVAEYGSEKIITHLDLGTVRGQKLSGISAKDVTYLMKVSGQKNTWVQGGSDTEKRMGRFGAFINDPRGRRGLDGVPLAPNVEFREDSNGFPAVYAIAQIKKGDELLASYGWDEDVWTQVVGGSQKSN
jgi:hypothetical protein